MDYLGGFSVKYSGWKESGRRVIKSQGLDFGAIFLGVVFAGYCYAFHWYPFPPASMMGVRADFLAFLALSFTLLAETVRAAVGMAKLGAKQRFAQFVLLRKSYLLLICLGVLCALLVLSSSVKKVNAQTVNALWISQGMLAALLFRHILRCEHLQTPLGAIEAQLDYLHWGELGAQDASRLLDVERIHPDDWIALLEAVCRRAERLGCCSERSTVRATRDSDNRLQGAASLSSRFPLLKNSLSVQVIADLHKQRVEGCFEALLAATRRILEPAKQKENKKLLWHVCRVVMRMSWAAVLCGQSEPTNRGAKLFKLAAILESAATEALNHQHWSIARKCLVGLGDVGTAAASLRDWETTAQIASAINQIGDRMVKIPQLSGEFVPLIKAFYGMRYAADKTSQLIPESETVPSARSGSEAASESPVSATSEEVKERCWNWAGKFRRVLLERPGHGPALGDIDELYQELFGQDAV